MPVDSESVTHNMWVLLMFRSVMVHIKGTYVFLSRTIFLSKHLICQHIMCNRLGVWNRHSRILLLHLTYSILSINMEFLLLWVLGGNVLDSGLRYEDAGSCYAAAQNSGKDLQEIGLSPPKFTCVPVADDKELKLLVPEQQGSRFPFWYWLDSLHPLLQDL